jgi:hypothetical protein
MELSTLSILQSSYWFYRKKARGIHLIHPSIKFFYPFLTKFLEFLCKFNGDYSLGLSFLNLIESFWNYSIVKSFESVHILVIMNRILKLVEKNDATTAFSIDLKVLLNDILISININKFRSCSTLWKNSDVLTLTSMELLNLAAEFKELDVKIDFWSINPKGEELI